MTGPMTPLEIARRDAQDLHRMISASIARAGTATWDDVASLQDEVLALSTRMKILAEEQAESVRAKVAQAIDKLEAAGRWVEDKAESARENVARANAGLLDGAHAAARGLSAAVAAARSDLWHMRSSR